MDDRELIAAILTAGMMPKIPIARRASGRLTEAEGTRGHHGWAPPIGERMVPRDKKSGSPRSRALARGSTPDREPQPSRLSLP